MRVGFAWVALAYAVAGVAAYLFGLYWAVRDMPPLAVAFFADVVATVVIFAFSYAFGNSSFYDAYWSVAPIPIGILSMANVIAPAIPPRIARIRITTHITA